MSDAIPEEIKQKLVAAGEAAGRAANAMTIEDAKTALEATAAAYASVAGDEAAQEDGVAQEEVADEVKGADNSNPMAEDEVKGATPAESTKETREAEIGKPAKGMRLTDDAKAYIESGENKPMSFFEKDPYDVDGGGKKKKKRGGKSQRSWKKNKRGGRQSKKRR